LLTRQRVGKIVVAQSFDPSGAMVASQVDRKN
jgi:hypothetical protein